MKFSLLSTVFLAAVPAFSAPEPKDEPIGEVPIGEANIENTLEARAIPGPMTNDYPYSGRCGGVDPWNYYKCQCTSFVAWRINNRLGLKFHNRYKGATWGNANQWDDAARATGVRIDNNPTPGSIAQTDAGGYGHVAWVSKVSGNTVTVEEYNYGSAQAYHTRVVNKNQFRYIHVKV